MSAGSRPNVRDDPALDESWNNLTGRCRRLLLLYRNSRNGKVVADVVELVTASVTHSADGKLSGWLSVLSPEEQAGANGRHRIAWTKAHIIPVECVLQHKLLPETWPGCNSFEVDSRNVPDRSTEQKYRSEIKEAWAVASELNLTRKAFQGWPAWQRLLVCIALAATVWGCIAWNMREPERAKPLSREENLAGLRRLVRAPRDPNALLQLAIAGKLWTLGCDRHNLGYFVSGSNPVPRFETRLRCPHYIMPSGSPDELRPCHSFRFQAYQVHPDLMEENINFNQWQRSFGPDIEAVLQLDDASGGRKAVPAGR